MAAYAAHTTNTNPSPNRSNKKQNKSQTKEPTFQKMEDLQRPRSPVLFRKKKRCESLWIKYLTLAFTIWNNARTVENAANADSSSVQWFIYDKP